MKKLGIIGILFCMFFSCREDIDKIGTGMITVEPPVIITDYTPQSDIVQGTIFGKVYDESENPIVDAIIKYDGKTYTSDSLGTFIIQNEALDREGTFFTVEADGYFKGSRRIYPKDGSVNYAYIQLLELNDIGSFDAATGDVIVGDDGIRITFNPNSIQSSTGALYDGEVTVAAKWLDPTAPNIAQIMPGDLLGLSAQVEEVSLVTYGMMAVELFDENGNNINIAEGNTATLSFPVPQELINEAPAEIPLWSFYDEEYGIWAEEGTATLQGNNYVGQVSHFSFWNCDAPFPVVYIEGQLVTEDGTPLPNTTICICPDGINNNSCGTTDNRGFFAGKMPANKDLILKLGYTAQDCEFNSINLGSFSADENLGSIQVTETGAAAFTVTGTIIDCYRNPVTNGFVKFLIGSTRTEYYVDEDGSFEVALLNCNNATEISITAVDINNLEEGTPVVFPISPEVDFQIISACGNTLTEFCTLNFDGTTTIVTNDLGARLNGDMFMAAGWMNDATFGIGFSITSDAIGSYDLSDCTFINLEVQVPTFNTNERLEDCQDDCTNLSFFDIIITENGGVGGHWAGEFSGEGIFTNQVDSTMTNFPFSGEFRVPINP